MSALGCSSSSTRSASASAPGREKTAFVSRFASICTHLGSHSMAGVICRSTTLCRIASSSLSR